MSWLESRLPKWRPFSGGSTAVLERDEAPAPEVALDDNTPKLMVLVNDASGMACFKAHTFPDAQSATEFVVYWFRDDTDGFSAFWAMREEPSSEDTLAGEIAEPLVIISDIQRTHVVYSFSFVDIGSAQGFVSDEIENGTDPGQINLYWALPVRLATNARGRTMLTPSVPPGVVPEEDTEAEAADIWAAHNQPGVEQVAKPDRAAEHRRVLQEAPNANTGVANGMSVGQETFELTSWMERRARDRRSSDRRVGDTHPSKDTFDVESGIKDAEARDHDKQPVAAGTSQDVAAELPDTVNVGVTPRELDVELQGSTKDEESDRLQIPAASAELTAQTPVELQVIRVDSGEQDTADEPALMEDNAVETAVEGPVEEEAREEQVALDEHQAERLNGNAASPEPVPSSVHSVHIEANSPSETPNEPPEESEDGFITLGPADIVVHTNGHSKVERDEPNSEVYESVEASARIEDEPAVETEAEATIGTTAELSPSDEDDMDEALDVGGEIDPDSSRALKVKRWEAREKPFEGFKSPPGRF